MLNDKEIAEMNEVLQAVNETSEFYKWQDIRRTSDRETNINESF
jgi:hypothetical protein